MTTIEKVALGYFYAMNVGLVIGLLWVPVSVVLAELRRVLPTPGLRARRRELRRVEAELKAAEADLQRIAYEASRELRAAYIAARAAASVKREIGLRP